jgi:hypothetical protein
VTVRRQRQARSESPWSTWRSSFPLLGLRESKFGCVYVWGLLFCGAPSSVRSRSFRMGRRTCPRRRCPTHTLVMVASRARVRGEGMQMEADAVCGRAGRGWGGVRNGTGSGRRDRVVVLEAQGCAGGQEARHSAGLRVAAGQARRVAVAVSRAALRTWRRDCLRWRASQPRGSGCLGRGSPPGRDPGDSGRRAAASEPGGSLRGVWDPRDWVVAACVPPPAPARAAPRNPEGDLLAERGFAVQVRRGATARSRTSRTPSRGTAVVCRVRLSQRPGRG